MKNLMSTSDYVEKSIGASTIDIIILKICLRVSSSKKVFLKKSFPLKFNNYVIVIMTYFLYLTLL